MRFPRSSPLRSKKLSVSGRNKPKLQQFRASGSAFVPRCTSTGLREGWAWGCGALHYFEPDREGEGTVTCERAIARHNERASRQTHINGLGVFLSRHLEREIGKQASKQQAGRQAVCSDRVCRICAERSQSDGESRAGWTDERASGGGFVAAQLFFFTSAQGEIPPPATAAVGVHHITFLLCFHAATPIAFYCIHASVRKGKTSYVRRSGRAGGRNGLPFFLYLRSRLCVWKDMLSVRGLCSGEVWRA